MRRTRQTSTRRTVLVAGSANIVVMGVKLAAGLLVGSSVLLAEAAHSLADTLNQAFLLASLHRPVRSVGGLGGNRAYEPSRPERFCWPGWRGRPLGYL
jgi:hypothetical protein